MLGIWITEHGQEVADATRRIEYQSGHAAGILAKTAADAVPAIVLRGRLVRSASGWGLLQVPNAIVRGLFDALHEPGVELPLKDGVLTAHVTVFNKAETSRLGDKINEWGRMFSWQLGPIKTVEVSGWNDVSRVWFAAVESPELKALRRSYGLTALPMKGGKELPLHLTLAVRRKGIHRNNEVSKAAEHTATHGGDTFDIERLIDSLQGRPVKSASLADLGKPNRSSAAGFSKKRYDAADPVYPGILGPGGELFDGRLKKMIGQDEVKFASNTPVYTIGHSNRSLDEFVPILKAHGVTMLADVRTVPRSLHNPQFNRDTLPKALHAAGIGYVHIPDLGGFRRKHPDSPNGGWRNESFRNYADYMGTPEFENGLATLATAARGHTPAIMCAEAVPWRCHRSLIADTLTARGVTVRDISSPTKAQLHVLKPWAHVQDGRVTYPALAEPAKAAAVHGSLAAAATNTDTAPTDGQIEAGNYKKGKFRWNGLTLSIENPAGSTRSGTDKSGKKWSTVMKANYGYILGTTGSDGDHVDAFVGPAHDTASHVYVVEQVDPKTGKFDELKCMIGYPTEETAKDGYLANYSKGWKGLGKITGMTVADFVDWMQGGDTTGGVKMAGFGSLFRRAVSHKALRHTLAGVTAGAGLTGAEYASGYADPNMSNEGLGALLLTNMAAGGLTANPATRRMIFKRPTLRTQSTGGLGPRYTRGVSVSPSRAIGTGLAVGALPKYVNLADATARFGRKFQDTVANHPENLEPILDPKQYINDQLAKRTEQALSHPTAQAAARSFSSTLGGTLAATSGGGLIGHLGGKALGNALFADDERLSYEKRRRRERLRSLVDLLGTGAGGVAGLAASPYISATFAGLTSPKAANLLDLIAPKAAEWDPRAGAANAAGREWTLNGWLRKNRAPHVIESPVDYEKVRCDADRDRKRFGLRLPQDKSAAIGRTTLLATLATTRRKPQRRRVRDNTLSRPRLPDTEYDAAADFADRLAKRAGGSPPTA